MHTGGAKPPSLGKTTCNRYSHVKNCFSVVRPPERQRRGHPTTNGGNMTGSLEGRVAFITGVARGQGRAHAVKLASLGCDIIGIDICENIASMAYPNATFEDLEETIALVEKQDRRILARKGDVRDLEGMRAVFREGYEQFGRLDIVLANAGIVRMADSVNPAQEWKDIIDVNLTGVWNTTQVTRQALIDGGRGGVMVLTSSSAGIKATGTPLAGGQAYNASKRGVVALMHTLALDLAPHRIRVNTIHPTGVVSGMTQNDEMAGMIAAQDPGLMAMQNALPIEILQPEDIANAVAFLVSDEAYYITGLQFALDAGFTIR